MRVRSVDNEMCSGGDSTASNVSKAGQRGRPSLSPRGAKSKDKRREQSKSLMRMNRKKENSLKLEGKQSLREETELLALKVLILSKN